MNTQSFRLFAFLSVVAAMALISACKKDPSVTTDDSAILAHMDVGPATPAIQPNATSPQISSADLIGLLAKCEQKTDGLPGINLFGMPDGEARPDRELILIGWLSEGKELQFLTGRTIKDGIFDCQWSDSPVDPDSRARLWM